jgi:hypothetical protein
MEVSAHGPDTTEAVEYVFTRGLRAVLGYVMGQMAAGRLHQMHPLLALQSFIGPILFHLMTRELVEERLGLDVTLEDAVSQLATSWVRAMRP